MIFRRAWRDNLPGMFAWGLGYSGLIALAALLYPLLNESNTLFTLLDGFGLLDNVFAVGNVDDLTGFPGYLALQAMGWGPAGVLGLSYSAGAAGRVAVEERQGTLDILLSTPISRWRFLTEKTLAIIATFLGNPGHHAAGDAGQFRGCWPGSISHRSTWSPVSGIYCRSRLRF